MNSQNTSKSIFDELFKHNAISKKEKIGGNNSPKKEALKTDSDKRSPFPKLPEVVNAEEEDLKSYWKKARTFFRGGIVQESPKEKITGMLPVLLAPFKVSEYMQAGYPYWLADEKTSDTELGFCSHASLNNLINGALNEFAPEENQAKVLKDNIARIEVNSRKKLTTDSKFQFPGIIADAIADTENALSISGEEGKKFKENNRQLLENLPKSGVLINSSPLAHFYILSSVIQVHFSSARKELLEKINQIKAKLIDIISVEKQKSPESKNPEELKTSYDFATSHINFDELSTVLPESGSEIMPTDRKARISNVINILNSAESVLFSNYAIAHVAENLLNNKAVDWEQSLVGCAIKSFKKGKGCSSAAKSFDQQLKKVAEVMAAIRIAELEIKNKYDTELHGEYFAHFDWRSFTKEEMNSTPLIILIEDSDQLMGVEMTEFSKLMASNRPIKFIAHKGDSVVKFTDDENAVRGDYEAPQEPAAFAISHRNTFVMQSTSVDPNHLFEGFQKGLSCFSPSLFVILSPDFNFKSSYDELLFTNTAVESRIFPNIIYDPNKGSHWGNRFDIGVNPQTEEDWPQYEVDILQDDSVESTLTVSFTPADFISLNSTFIDHFLVVPPQYWHNDLVLLSDYISMPSEENYAKVPYLWMVDAGNLLHKVVISWPVLLACQERLDYWHFIRENCGVQNYHVKKAIEKTRAEVEEQSSKEIESLKLTHEQEIKTVKEETAGEAMKRLSEVLLDIDTVALPDSLPIAASIPAPVEEKKSEETLTADEQEEENVEEEDLSLAEPWIDSILCTTCNECTDLNNNMFKYNDDKQAYLADASAGTFAELVEAAEKCPPNIIHPGVPLNPSENGLEDLIKRAEPYN